MVLLEQVLTKSAFLHDINMGAIGSKLWNQPPCLAGLSVMGGVYVSRLSSYQQVEHNRGSCTGEPRLWIWCAEILGTRGL